MAAPNVHEGMVSHFPNLVFIKNGSLAVAMPGVTKITVDDTVEVREIKSATKQMKYDYQTWHKITGTITVTGENSDFLQVLHGMSSGTGQTLQIIEDVAITTGSGTLTAGPSGDDWAVAVYDENGKAVDMTDSSPSLGECQVSTTTLTLDATVDGVTYTVWYVSDDTSDGIKHNFDFSTSLNKVDELWFTSQTLDDTDGEPYASNQARGMYLKQVVFHGGLPLYRSGDGEEEVEITFTAKVYDEGDLVNYFPTMTASPTS
jgi:hypothetical protein